jgi:hypothetical protein
MISEKDYNGAADYFENRAEKVKSEPDRMARFLTVAAKYRALTREAEENKLQAESHRERPRMATLIKLTVDSQNRPIWINADMIVTMELIDAKYTAVKLSDGSRHTFTETPEVIANAAKTLVAER